MPYHQHTASRLILHYYFGPWCWRGDGSSDNGGLRGHFLRLCHLALLALLLAPLPLLLGTARLSFAQLAQPLLVVVVVRTQVGLKLASHLVLLGTELAVERPQDAGHVLADAFLLRCLGL